MMFQKDMEKNKIKKEMTFIEALEKYPYLSKIFGKYNFHCIFCPRVLYMKFLYNFSTL